MRKPGRRAEKARPNRLERARASLKGISRHAYTTAEMKAASLSPRMLNYFIATGRLVRLAHGVYSFPDLHALDFEELVKEKLLQAPRGIIGLKTALRLHDLTEESPKEIDILVPWSSFPQRKLEDVRIYRMKDSLLLMEATTIRGIPVTKLERTLVDLLRVGEPISLILEMIRTARAKRKKVSVPLLQKLSEPFRVKHKMQRILEALM